MRIRLLALVVPVALLCPSLALATTYQVGPTRTHKQPSEVRSLLMPGDVVEIDGDTTYTGGLIFDAPGTEASKITVRGLRVNGKRPIISGGGNAIEARASHYVFEALDITQGTSALLLPPRRRRHAARLGGPRLSRAGHPRRGHRLRLDAARVHRGPPLRRRHRRITRSTWPPTRSLTRARSSACSTATCTTRNGGNNVKSRAERNEIYYNWIEGALYHELELHRPRRRTPENACARGLGRGRQRARQDQDDFVVRASAATAPASRTGATASSTTPSSRARGTSAVFRLFDGIESVEMHNNVLAQRGSGALAAGARRSRRSG